MVVKEISKETQKNVDVKIIEESFFDSMSGFYGKNDLSWIGCLFRELRNNLNIEKGMIHYYHGRGTDKVEDHLTQSGIYGQYGNPKAFLYTKELPKGFNLFMTGPGYNDKNLRIICSSPQINIRDFEEWSIVDETTSKIEELVKGKHENVGGILYKNKPGIETRFDRVILYKTWKMPVKPCFSFREDIGDIQIFAQIYDNFFNYQIERDESFKNTSTKIVKEVLDKQTNW